MWASRDSDPERPARHQPWERAHTGRLRSYSLNINVTKWRLSVIRQSRHSPAPRHRRHEPEPIPHLPPLPPGKFHQPGTGPAGLQPPRLRPGPGRLHAAAGAPALPVHRLLQPGRVLRDPGRRPQGAAQARLQHPHHRRQDAPGGVPPGIRRSPPPDARAVRAAQRRRAAGPGKGGYPVPAPHPLDRRPARMGAGLLLPRSDAGAHPHRPGPFPPLPPGAQQEPQLRRGTGGARRLRPQLRRRHRPGAPGAAPGHPPAPGTERGRIQLRLPLLHPPCLRRRAVRRHERARLLPVPRHPQFRPLRR